MDISRSIINQIEGEKYDKDKKSGDYDGEDEAFRRLQAGADTDDLWIAADFQAWEEGRKLGENTAEYEG